MVCLCIWFCVLYVVVIILGRLVVNCNVVLFVIDVICCVFFCSIVLSCFCFKIVNISGMIIMVKRKVKFVFIRLSL